MLEQNKEIFDYCNIPLWWNKGYTGKNVKIGMFDEDFNINSSFFDGKAHMMPNSGLGKGKEWSHGAKVAGVLHTTSPDVDIYLLSKQYPNKPNYIDALDWAYENNIRLINMSMLGTSSPEHIKADKLAVERGITLVCSAGNDGYRTNQNTLGYSAQTENWISIGGCILDNGKPKRIYYSSYGEQLDIMGFTNVYIRGNGDYVEQFGGTSCASPFIVGQLALWYQYFYEKYNEYPTPQESLMFLVSNCEDLDIVGKDKFTGNGIFRLPKCISNTVIKMIIGKKEILCNGNIGVLNVAPIIKEGRTLLPIRYIIEPLGGTISWDGTTQKVTIKLNNIIIEMWINNPIAKVNGINKYIDENNYNIKPILISGRTMLPVRFVSENLGCQVLWDEKNQTVTIIK